MSTTNRIYLKKCNKFIWQDVHNFSHLNTPVTAMPQTGTLPQHFIQAQSKTKCSGYSQAMNRYTTWTIQPFAYAHSQTECSGYSLFTLHWFLLSYKIPGDQPLFSRLQMSHSPPVWLTTTKLSFHTTAYTTGSGISTRVGHLQNPVFSSHLYPPIQNIMCALSPTLLCITSITLPLCLPSGFHLVICHTALHVGAQYFSGKLYHSCVSKWRAKVRKF